MNPVIPSPHIIQPSALAKLSLRDKLLLAQAVHEIGTSPPDWGRVSALLLSHPLIRQQSRLEQANAAGLTLGRIFGTRECERAWVALMRQRGLVLGKDELPPEPTSSTPTTPKPKEPRGLQPRTDRSSQLALAQLLYAERMEELKEQIREKEEQFKSLVKEIDEIKSGKADARLEMELRIEMENLANGPPLPPSTPGSVAQSVVMTPGSNASTTPKSAKGKGGRARGESLVNTPDGTGSAPGSAGKKASVAAAAAGAGKKGDRRASIDETPSKVPSGPTPALPSTPSITLPLPTKPTPTEAAATLATTSAAPATTTATATATDASTTDKPATTDGGAGAAMTTEEAEQAVATAATEAAVKALQDEKAAKSALQAEVDKAAEKVVETETNLELSAQAEGDANAMATQPPSTAAAGTTEAAKPAPAVDAAPAKAVQEAPAAAPAAEKPKDNQAPPAEVVVKDTTDKPVEEVKSPEKSAPTTAPTVPPTTTATTEAEGSNATLDTATAASGKRKRDDEQPEAASTAFTTTTSAAAVPAAGTEAKPSSEAGSPVKKARTAVPSSEGEMDSEDEAEAAVGVDSPAPAASADVKTTAAETETKPAPAAEIAKSAVGEKKKEEAMDEDTDSSDSSTDSSDSSSSDSEQDQEQVKSLPPSTSTSSSTNNNPRSSPTRRPPPSTTRPTPTPTPTPLPPTSDRQKAVKRKQTQVLLMLLTEVSNHTHGNLFHSPIKEADAPDYYTLIRQPLDIKTIKAKIKEGSIGTAKQLQKALNLMFANSLMYNRPGTEVFRMANEMRVASEDIFRRYEGTQRF